MVVTQQERVVFSVEPELFVQNSIKVEREDGAPGGGRSHRALIAEEEENSPSV